MLTQVASPHPAPSPQATSHLGINGAAAIRVKQVKRLSNLLLLLLGEPLGSSACLLITTCGGHCLAVALRGQAGRLLEKWEQRSWTVSGDSANSVSAAAHPALPALSVRLPQLAQDGNSQRALCRSRDFNRGTPNSKLFLPV